MNKTCKKIERGVYEYRGFIMSNMGYFNYEKRVIWEGIRDKDTPKEMVIHGDSKKMLKVLIDDMYDGCK